jgi:hypothetical protein
LVGVRHRFVWDVVLSSSRRGGLASGASLARSLGEPQALGGYLLMGRRG